nr:retrovirus-related Pol polyprotein LINE-1 [Tanacetum cinerariifolium]
GRKIAVAKAEDKAYGDLYKKLDSKDGVNEIYKIAKARERRRRDIGNVKYIKDEGGRTIVREEDIRTRWGEYFSSLFNETPSKESRPEGSGEVGRSSSPAHFGCYYSRINHGEVRAALRKMGRNKAVGPDQIPIEAWRGLEDEGVKWLTCLFNKIFSSAKMPDEWRLSEVISVYKNKGDAQACSNYRENQFGFMSGRSMTEAIYLLRSVMEKYRERQRDLHIAFLDLEKAYDSVPHDIRKTLEDNGLRVSREKTKYLRCDFGRYEVVHQEMDIHIRDQILQPNESFRYLGSVLHRSGRIVDDVDHRIRAGWMKWMATSGVLCDKRIPLKLKGKFYRAAIRPAMLYGSECWPITKALAFRVEVAELRMLSRRLEEKGRPKLRWEDRLKIDMKELRLSEDMTSDRKAWRDIIRINM